MENEKVRVERALCYRNMYYVTFNGHLQETREGDIIGFGTKEEAKEEAKRLRRLFRLGYKLSDIYDTSYVVRNPIG
jgi:hypothetical protein